MPEWKPATIVVENVPEEDQMMLAVEVDLIIMKMMDQ